MQEIIIKPELEAAWNASEIVNVPLIVVMAVECRMKL